MLPGLIFVSFLVLQALLHEGAPDDHDQRAERRVVLDRILVNRTIGTDDCQPGAAAVYAGAQGVNQSGSQSVSQRSRPKWENAGARGAQSKKKERNSSGTYAS